MALPGVLGSGNDWVLPMPRDMWVVRWMCSLPVYWNLRFHPGSKARQTNARAAFRRAATASSNAKAPTTEVKEAAA
jgi:hypothetical protein